MKLSLKKQRLKNQKSNIKEIYTDKTMLIAGGENGGGLPRDVTSVCTGWLSSKPSKAN